MIRMRTVDGMRQEVYSKGKEMHNEMSDLWFSNRKTKVVERWLQQLMKNYSFEAEHSKDFIIMQAKETYIQYVHYCSD